MCPTSRLGKSKHFHFTAISSHLWNCTAHVQFRTESRVEQLDTLSKLPCSLSLIAHITSWTSARCNFVRQLSPKYRHHSCNGHSCNNLTPHIYHREWPSWLTVLETVIAFQLRNVPTVLRIMYSHSTLIWRKYKVAELTVDALPLEVQRILIKSGHTRRTERKEWEVLFTMLPNTSSMVKSRMLLWTYTGYRVRMVAKWQCLMLIQTIFIERESCGTSEVNCGNFQLLQFKDSKVNITFLNLNSLHPDREINVHTSSKYILLPMYSWPSTNTMNTHKKIVHAIQDCWWLR